MRPIALEFQAFESYPEKEYIDFNTLDKNGLFLICGKTGSGKTTILDAMTFALYGKSSGDNRNDLGALRCNRCNPKSDTFVRFDFSANGGAYRFERCLTKKRKNLASSQNAYKLNDAGVWEPLFENPKEADMNKKAVELIGLSYDQFRQVIILPQGQFEKLLTAKTKDKEAILQTIFGMEKWEKIANRYYDLADKKHKQLAQERTDMDNMLREEQCSDINELNEKIATIEKDINDRKQVYDKENYAKQEEELAKARVNAEKFVDLHKKEDEQKKLENRKVEYNKWKEALADAEKVEPLRKIFEEKSRIEGEIETRKQNCSDKNAIYIQKQKQFDDANAELEEHKKNAPEYEQWKQNVTIFESKVKFYEEIDKRRVAVKELKGNLKEAEDIYNKAVEDYNKTETKVKELFEQQQSFSGEYNKLVSCYMNGISAELAKDLKEGMACPVCGSLEHPKKALPAENSVTRAAVDEKEKERQEKAEEWRKADDKRQTLDEKKNEKKRIFDKLTLEYEKAGELVKIAEQEMIPGITSLEQLKQAIEKLNEDINDYEKGTEKKLTAKNDAEKELSEAKGKLSSEQGELEKAENEGKSITDNLKAAIHELGFADEASVKGKMLSQKNRSELQGKKTEFETLVKTVADELEIKRAELEGKKEQSIAEIDDQLKQIEKVKHDFVSKQAAAEQEKTRLEKKAETISGKLEKYEKTIKEAGDDLKFAKALRGDTGIGLLRYILGIKFSAVISAANQLLSKVHDGRYRLMRTDEKGNGNKRGLNLQIRDNYSEDAAARFVETLSGGEKFLTSLSLALGLAAIAKSGGINVEALFIDEGFGSLDNDSINDAMDILSTIQKAHGSVGIISHVQVLQDNIPTKLIVEKRVKGSTLKMVVG